MTIEPSASLAAQPSFAVYPADVMRVDAGANLGDAVGLADEMMLDDIYCLDPSAETTQIQIDMVEKSQAFRIAKGSPTGRAGAALHLDCTLAFMGPDGRTIEGLVLVELAPQHNHVAAIYLLPLVSLHPRTPYTLIGITADDARRTFASLACVSFAQGTHITLATGAQRPIEALRPGDLVLTRDNGAQPVRWIGHQCQRAMGARAPVVFAPGSVNNEGVLRLSPNQRLFFYQREDRTQAGRAEVMIRAMHLVNGDTICRAEGGFEDYYQLVFDAHEFIYAEGVATESLAFDLSTLPALPDHVADRLVPGSGPAQGRPEPVELFEGLLEPSIAADVLREASTS